MSVSLTTPTQYQYSPPPVPVAAQSSAAGLFSANSGATASANGSNPTSASQGLSPDLQALLLQQQTASASQASIPSIPSSATDPDGTSQAVPGAAHHHHGHHPHGMDSSSPTDSDATGSTVVANGSAQSRPGGALVNDMLQAIRAYASTQPIGAIATAATSV